MDTAALIPFVKELAQASGEIILRHYRDASLAVEQKEDQSPVTAADREAEVELRKRILARFPDHGIIAEEFGHERENAEYVWVLDPIDGTKSFVTGVCLFGTLIGLLHKGRPILGAINQPVLGELCIGDNRTTWLNDKPVRVRNVTRLEDAVLLTTDTTSPARHQDGTGWDRLVASTKMLRTWGDCYGYLLVACGKADIMADPVMNPWDLLPLIPIINGAGGTITDWQGADAARGTSSVAANPALHKAVMQALASR